MKNKNKTRVERTLVIGGGQGIDQRGHDQTDSSNPSTATMGAFAGWGVVTGLRDSTI